MTAPTPTLTPLAYHTLCLFAAGMDIPEIADKTGQQWLSVRQVVNINANGHRSNARRMVDAHPPVPAEVIEQAVAESLAKAGPNPAAKPSKAGPNTTPKAEPAPLRERLDILAEVIDATPSGSNAFEPLAKAVTHWALEATDTDPDLPEPDAYDLATLDGLLSNAAMHSDQEIRDVHATAVERLAELRRLMLHHRRRELVAAEIAACEARLAKLHQWEVATAEQPPREMLGAVRELRPDLEDR